MRRKGAQMVEESLLVALSLLALIIVLSLFSNVFKVVQNVQSGSENILDKFIVQVLGEDFNELWNSSLGQVGKIFGG